ncbi:MAG: right-handed parallel beta-helix repeat-containing protein [Clostridia bacterium]|nr:right-handed parallel beta-helix repeat-containing protein [Clostridia bacterium]
MRQEFLPDGRPFPHWEDTTDYQRELYVRADAAPGGDGSKTHPFNTIQAAADAARPGTKIWIHGGEYHETVRPTIGGESADQMICFEGVPGEEAIITGAEVYTGEYTQSEGWKRSQFMDRSNAFEDPNARLYAMRLPRNCFDGSNPFGMVNGGLTPWFFRDFAKMFHTKKLEERKIVIQKRGMLFCDGKRLTQVAVYYEMGKIPGSFYVEDDGIHIHIRLFDDSNPADHKIEFTAREQCFAPDEKYLAYMHIKNLIFEKAGTGFPPPQRGALSTQCGNHWIIENCTVRQVNGTGMDIGFQAPARMSNATKGYMYVTGCKFLECGFAALVGTCGQSEDIDYIEQRQDNYYIADNLFDGCCWQENEDSMEAASLKVHHTRDSMILRNRIINTPHGCGMWLDASHMNMAVRENVVLHTFTRKYGAITIECSRDDIEVTNNVIVDVKGFCRDEEHGMEQGGMGFFTIACEQVKVQRNIILDCDNKCLHFGETGQQRYTDGKGCTGLDNDLYENVFSDSPCAIRQCRMVNAAEGNVYGKFYEPGYIQAADENLYTTFPYWQKRMKKDQEGKMVDFAWQLNEDDTGILFVKGEEKRGVCLMENVQSQVDDVIAWLKA